jgi:DNA-directed RNA polymerase I subunit RPA49
LDVNRTIVNYPVVQAPPKTSFKCYAKKKPKTLVEGETAQVDDFLLAGETETVEFVTNEDETARVAESGCQYAPFPPGCCPRTLPDLPAAIWSLYGTARPGRSPFCHSQRALISLSIPSRLSSP